MPRNKDSRFYILYDSSVNLYKFGASNWVRRRSNNLSKQVKTHLELIFKTPGHDYFVKYFELPRVRHPVKHGGQTEWYKNTAETVAFIKLIKEHPEIAAAAPMGRRELDNFYAKFVRN